MSGGARPFSMWAESAVIGGQIGKRMGPDGCMQGIPLFRRMESNRSRLSVRDGMDMGIGVQFGRSYLVSGKPTPRSHQHAATGFDPVGAKCISAH